MSDKSSNMKDTLRSYPDQIDKYGTHEQVRRVKKWVLDCVAHAFLASPAVMLRQCDEDIYAAWWYINAGQRNLDWAYPFDTSNPPTAVGKLPDLVAAAYFAERLAAGDQVEAHVPLIHARRIVSAPDEELRWQYDRMFTWLYTADCPNVRAISLPRGLVGSSPTTGDKVREALNA